MGLLRNIGNFLTFGAVDRNEAKSIAHRADRRQANAKADLEDARDKTQSDLEALGKLKQDVYATTLTDFVEAYEIIGKVDLTPLKKKNDALEYKTFQLECSEMKAVTISLKDASIAVGGSALAGTVGVCGAYGLAGVIGCASTGTAIGTLSGAALSNATLAWLGGGAISAGGAGVAGGMVVLGGIALAPLAIFGMFLGTSKGKQQFNEAKNYSDQIDVLVEKIITLIEELSQIRRGCFLLHRSILGLNQVMSMHIEKMNQIAERLENRSFFTKNIVDPIKKYVFRLSLLTEEEAQVFTDSANCASVLKQLIDKPLMGEEGAFLSDVLEFFEDKKPRVDAIIETAQVQFPALMLPAYA